jgi:beta-lactam-binding protein with PASTA domain
MPNVVGVEWPDALAAMVVAGVRQIPLGYFQADPVTVVWVKATAKPGFVTAQTPNAGATLAANASATLTVSAYPVSVSNFGGVGS